MPVIERVSEGADPPPLSFISFPGVDLTWVRTDAIEPPSEEILSNDERARAKRFVFDRDRHRWIVTRATLRRLLAERLDTQPQSLEFSYGEFGKPALAGIHASASIRFNVSHSHDMTVFAFTDGLEVGVDVERLVALPEADSIAERMFAADEVAAYRQLPDAEKIEGFMNCWTRKEAFVKAVGEGLSFPLDRFSVSLAPGLPACIVEIFDGRGEPGDWMLSSFFPEVGFVGAVAVRKRG